MKSGCLEASHKKSCGGAKLLIVFFVFIIGVFFAAEARYAFFRLEKIESGEPAIVDSKVLWGTVSTYEERFWPLYYLNKINHAKELEKYFPVEAEIEFDSWGCFRVKITKLTPEIKMYWGNKYWYISDSGKAWLASLRENEKLNKELAENRPLLVWSSDRQLPIGLSSGSGNIMQTSLSVSNIREWYRNISVLGWEKEIKYIVALVKDKKPAVTLFFKHKKGGSGVKIMLADSPDAWIEAGMAVQQIYKDLTVVSPDIFIDTTYNNKILIKNIKETNK